MTSLIDWSVAERTAQVLSPTPPAVTPAEAQAVVAELREATERAAAQVAELTRLTEPAVTAETVVVDRPGWVSANTASMSAVMDPLVERLAANRPVGRFTAAVGGRATGAQAGAILAFLSGKVLGQFEFFSVDKGQLLLVAPNIVAVERALRVDPSDFRFWVCLHEVTHRVQFTAVPWLRQHMLDEVAALTETVDVDPDALRERLRTAVSELVKLTRGDGDSAGLIAALSSPESREVMDRLTGFMSLVEGHAEYVMNAVPAYGDPDPAGDRAPVRGPSAARRQPAGPVAAHRCSAWTPRPGSTPRVRSSSDRWSSRSAWTASTRSGPARKRCPARPRSPPRPTGCAGCTAEHGPAPGGGGGPISRPPGTGRPTAGAARAGGLLRWRGLGGAGRRAGLRRAGTGRPAGLVTVDHGLQPDSAAQAARVVELGHRLGLDPVCQLRVRVGSQGGPEAAARTARYAALDGS